MENEITKEEKEAIECYKNERYLSINQLLAEDIETDIALLMAGNSLEYSEETVAQNIEIIQKIYEAMMKSFQKDAKESWVFFKGTSIVEIDQLKLNPNVNRFFLSMENREKAKSQLENHISRPVLLKIEGSADIPYKKLEENTDEIMIAPFTSVKNMEKVEDSFFEEYKIELENQELEVLPEEEKEELYQNILKNANLANQKMKNCIDLENENMVHYENIRKLEQLLARRNQAMEQESYEEDTTPSEREEDLDDMNRIQAELDGLKDTATKVFEMRQENAKFIVDWKKDVIKYVMSVCGMIKNRYVQEQKESLEEMEMPEEQPQELLEEKETEFIKEVELDPQVAQVKAMCQENVAVVDTLLENIKNLITKQQNHARIAEAVDSSYRALNNAFEMKNYAEELQHLVDSMANQVNLVAGKKEELDKISKTSLQVSTLLNYLNNPKSAVGKRITRFDEIHIIEENELKRGIAETIKNIRCEAELKKLRDDIDIIEDKSKFKKLIGKFTGRNKLDEVMLDQIQIRQTAIRKTFKARMPLAYNYSIHKLIAEIEMFIKENEDDELVTEDVNELKKIRDILKENFVIIDSKVVSIIDQKTGKNLPLASGKISKKELVEIDTYRFLHKYGYDKTQNSEEPEYQDTLANEIKRIVDYIKTSEVL